MAAITPIVFGILALIAHVLLIALFVKKSYTVKRHIIINQPVEKVFAFVKYLKNQDTYSAWAKLDPAMQKTYTGTDGTVGFVSAWDSQVKKAGKGEQTIIEIEELKKVAYAIRFIKPFAGNAYAKLSTKAIDAQQTKVCWALQSKMKYPSNIMLLFMNMDNVIGKDLEEGLSQLKVLLEHN